MATEPNYSITETVVIEASQMIGTQYTTALFGLWVIVVTVLIQAVVASVAHRRQSHYIPGIVDPSLGQESFVFRSHRTLSNSLENLVLMMATSLLSIMAGVDHVWVNACVWVYAMARILHMWLYYKIATENNPSPRSYFYMLGLLANVVLLVKLGISLVI